MKAAVLIAIFATFGLIQNSQRCSNAAVEKNTMTTPTPERTAKFDRLPENIKPDTEVRKDVKNHKGEIVSYETTTVEKRLNELKARYKNGKLVDRKGREIRFFEPLCRGVSRGIEGDREDQRAKDRELAELKKKFTVLVVLCDPSVL